VAVEYSSVVINIDNQKFALKWEFDIITITENECKHTMTTILEIAISFLFHTHQHSRC
jgi:hypothetical protein